MNQLEAPARDCTQGEDGFLVVTAAESTKESSDAPERHATTSPEKSCCNNSAATSPVKMFPPPPPLELSEARRSLRLSNTLEPTKHENPEVDQEDEDVDDERMDDEGNQGELHVLDDTCNGGAWRESISCEPMVCYNGFESVGKPTSRALPHLAFGDDGEDDVVNFRSPIVCKPSSSRSSTLSPTCVSAVVRDDRDSKLDEPSWSIEEFQQYLDMLDMLQEVCNSSGGEEMSLSADSLGKMERLLTLLLPPGVEL